MGPLYRPVMLLRELRVGREGPWDWDKAGHPAWVQQDASD